MHSFTFRFRSVDLRGRHTVMYITVQASDAAEAATLMGAKLRELSDEDHNVSELRLFSIRNDATGERRVFSLPSA